tara:strand:+ start:39 stop:395 length:357 start_codon:yes stop_codon:yes gene_type:complete
MSKENNPFLNGDIVIDPYGYKPKECSSKIIYAQLKNGSTYKYLWLGNDHFADLYNSWDYENNEGKHKGMLDFDHTISYTFDMDEIKNEQSIVGIDVEDGLEDGEIVRFTIRNVKWEVA